MMNRLLRFAVSAVILVCTAGCCSSPGPKESPQPAPPARTTRISGRVIWKGVVPPNKPISVEADEQIVQSRGGRPLFGELWVVAPDAGLANVIVCVVGKPAVEIPSAPREPVILHMEGGVYTPHVLALRVGQTLHLEIPENERHHAHFNGGKRYPGFVVPYPDQSRDCTFDFPDIVRAKCDIHGWMGAWIGVFDHPWFAVTGPDGRFELNGLPPGKYHLKAWHERGGIREADVEIPSDGTEAHADFEFGPE